jgi:hypothetical protein
MAMQNFKDLLTQRAVEYLVATHSISHDLNNIILVNLRSENKLVIV